MEPINTKLNLYMIFGELKNNTQEVAGSFLLTSAPVKGALPLKLLWKEHHDPESLVFD